MLKPMIRTIDSWRFELPLALTLGAAAAFATIAAPPHLFGAPVGSVVSKQVILVQWAAAALIASTAGVIAYLVMRPRSVLLQTIIEDEDDAEAEATEAPSIAAERLVRLRRADAHPDAPPRQPIRASRDLGEPFMDVADFPALPSPLIDLVVPPGEPIADAEYIEIDPSLTEPELAEIAPMIEPPIFKPSADQSVDDAQLAAEPAYDTPAEPVIDAAMERATVEQASSIEAFEPECEPAPTPTRMRRQSLSSMMERLSAGLERRNGEPLAPPPAAAVAEALSGSRDVKPDLRNALDQLNRLASRGD